MASHALSSLFSPAAVAVIGASRDKSKLGRQILDNIKSAGFRGKIYPVNLSGGRIAGLPAYRTITEVPGTNPDRILAIIAIPAAFVYQEVENCAARGIKDIIIISAGFREASRLGRSWEEKIAICARKNGLNILGPNCLGLVSAPSKLNATFSAASSINAGQIALVSQSGAIGSAVLDWLRTRQLGLRYFVSLGNKAVTGENQILNYLQTDKEISLIVIYLEEINDGQQLISQISRLVKSYPVAVLKAGSSPAGRELARSHTGSLVGSFQAARVGLEQAGAIWLENLEELFNLLTIMNQPGRAAAVKKNQKFSVLSNAGGLAVLAADEISRQGLLSGLNQDLLGDASAEQYRVALEKMSRLKAANPILTILTPQAMTEPEKTASIISKIAKTHPDKLVISSFVGGKAVQKARLILQENNIPTFDYPEEAVSSWSKIANQLSQVGATRPLPRLSLPSKSPLNSSDYLQSFRLLDSYGLSPVPTRVYDSQARYKYPVVLKLVGPADWHKTDRGGVVTNLKNQKELAEAARRLSLANRHEISSGRAYLVVQPQQADCQEMIIGFKRDRSFGPLVLIGRGGIYTEVFHDNQLAVGLINLSQAQAMIKKLQIYPILAGTRGQKRYDLMGLAKALVCLSRLAMEHPEIKELDINPLFVGRSGVYAGDIRIII